MLASDFDYDLPARLIAQHPAAERGASRLLVVEAHGAPRDGRFADLAGLLAGGDLLVLNDTRVVPARLHGRKPTGGRVEVLVERPLGPGRFLAHLRARRALRDGTRIELAPGVGATVAGRAEDLYELALDDGVDLAALLEAHGEVPLPPYIRRPPGPEDARRYQTVYARADGAVAAPTAGLHFDQPLLDRLQAGGVGVAHLTLHVGAGTFQPLRSDEVEAHRMHAERVEVPAATCAAIEAARAAGGRVVAVGTTCVRALEAAALDGRLEPFRGETRLFIRPGFRFRVVDALVTNFHLPRSTLLMLVCAFAGTERVLAAYRHAVRAAYRFYSYGDAMFLSRAPA